ncbi:MAG: hypothetical protein LC104_18505 [Bacteroidales bacterium]|nr:hypothetical protein [Bacteroidales bacterium]
MRTIAALLALPLGIVGVLLAIVVTVGVWWAAFDLNSRVGRVADRVDQGFDRTDAALVRLHEKLRTTRTAVALVRQTATTRLAAKLDTPALRQQADTLTQQLTPLLERAEALADSLRTLAQLLRMGADVLEEFGGSSERVARLHTAADRITEATDTLADLRGRAVAWRENTVHPQVQTIIQLIDDSGPSLDRLTEGLETIRTQVADARSETAAAVQVTRRWIFGVAGGITLLVFWAGIGQVSLFGWGRHQFRPSMP